MKWSLNQLRKYAYQAFEFNETIELEEIYGLKTEIINLSPVNVRGRMDFNESRITFHLVIAGVMTLPCSRTLIPVEYPFEIHTTESVLHGNSYEPIDSDEHVLTSDIVDLRPFILENILLEIPMQIFSEDNNCEPIAPGKGRDWVLMDEEELERKKEQEKPKVDPRLAGLAKFFQKEDTIK